MRALLISPYPDITSFGVRTLSAWLKAQGHATRLVFLPDPFGDDLVQGVDRYPASVMEQVARLAADADLVGISLMTNYFDNAVQITRSLKAAGVGAPILWGGVHATIRPEQCLEHADLVCLGDGEEALSELMDRLAAGRDYDDVANIWLKRQGRTIKNPLRPLTQDLDRYPVPDYSHEDHWVLLEGRVAPLTLELTDRLLSRGTVSQYLGMAGYQTMTGRGCPHKCSYCINDTLKNLYGAKGYLRWRSTEHVMAELEQVRRLMPFIRFVWISDDAFFARKLEDLRDFCEQYKARVGLPFSALASPLTMSEEKMALLVDAGLVYLQMGVQTGSPRIQELFNRKAMNNEVMMKAIHIIHGYSHKLFPTSYDFILDVPYENDQDKIESIRFISRIPQPYKLQPFSLVLYPGTKLHQMASADGFICDESSEIYTKSYTMRAPTYLNLLITVAKGGRMATERDAVVPLGYQPAPLPEGDRDDLLRQMGADPARPLVSFVGNWGATYDLDVVVEAAARLEGRSDALFVLAGDGHERERLLPRIDGLSNVVAPGWIETTWGETVNRELHERLRRQTPLQRWGTPEDVAAAVLFLASPAAAFFTGQVLMVNGGVVM